MRCVIFLFFKKDRFVSIVSNAIFSLLQSLVLKSVLKKGGQSELFFLTAEKNPPNIEWKYPSILVPSSLIKIDSRMIPLAQYGANEPIETTEQLRHPRFVVPRRNESNGEKEI